MKIADGHRQAGLDPLHVKALGRQQGHDALLRVVVRRRQLPGFRGIVGGFKEAVNGGQVFRFPVFPQPGMGVEGLAVAGIEIQVLTPVIDPEQVPEGPARLVEAAAPALRDVLRRQADA